MLQVGNLVLKKDFRMIDKPKFSSPWEGSFIVVDIAMSGAYVPAEINSDILKST
jgi:hypothetical protein